MTIATQNDLINARTNKRQNFSLQKTSVSGVAAGVYVSLYRSAGSNPIQPAIPAAAALCTKALSWNFQNPTAPDKTYLDYLDINIGVGGRLTMYDRLFHIGGFSGTVTTAQTVNSQSLLTFPFRGYSVEDVYWMLEWYASTGSTAVTANVAVTNTDLSTEVIAVALAATRPAASVIFIPPNAGKRIASIQSVTLSASTLTAGNFGVTCAERISGASGSIATANVGRDREGILAEIPNDACLYAILEASGTSTGDARGELTLIQG